MVVRNKYVLKRYLSAFMYVYYISKCPPLSRSNCKMFIPFSILDSLCGDEPSIKSGTLRIYSLHTFGKLSSSNNIPLFQDAAGDSTLLQVYIGHGQRVLKSQSFHLALQWSLGDVFLREQEHFRPKSFLIHQQNFFKPFSCLSRFLITFRRSFAILCFSSSWLVEARGPTPSRT